MTTREKMKSFEIEIGQFLENNQHKRRNTSLFPFDKYKELNQLLSNLHIEMACDKEIHINEGIEWFRCQMQKLIDFLP